MITPCKAGLLKTSCVLENDKCIYCFRTLKEIQNWVSMTREQRFEIINRIKNETISKSS